MSILDRLQLLVRSNLNAARPDGSSASGEIDRSLREARAELRGVAAEERRLIDGLRAARERAETWEDRAQLAVERGEDGLAREALRARREALGEVDTWKERLREQRAWARDLESSLRALEYKADAWRERRGAERRPGEASRESDWDRELRRRVAERGEGSPPPRSAPRPAPDLGGRYESGADPFETEGSFDDLDRMADRIARMEASVAASDALSDDPLFDPKRARVERSFRELEAERADDDDLAALKSRFSED